VRCPAGKGLPNDIYHILHHSFVHILVSPSLPTLLASPLRTTFQRNTPSMGSYDNSSLSRAADGSGR
jgi:hypothetical protein